MLCMMLILCHGSIYTFCADILRSGKLRSMLCIIQPNIRINVQCEISRCIINYNMNVRHTYMVLVKYIHAMHGHQLVMFGNHCPHLEAL